MSIAAVVLTKNSEKTLKECLASLVWCSEIIVVDDESVDKTRVIAKQYTKHVYVHALGYDFAAQRNFALQKTHAEWILFVDSDETVSSKLRLEIEHALQQSAADIKGYYIHRVDTLWGKKLLHGETGNIWLLRLGKKNTGLWQGSVHETWNIKGKTEKLRNALLHFPHPTVDEFLRKINFYSTLRAQELYLQKIHVSFLDIILYPKGKFYLNYFFRLGFLDGIPGFLSAIFMSFHSFLVRGKLWHLQNSHQ